MYTKILIVHIITSLITKRRSGFVVH